MAEIEAHECGGTAAIAVTAPPVFSILRLLESIVAAPLMIVWVMLSDRSRVA